MATLTGTSERREQEQLSPKERAAAILAAVVLSVIAVWLVLDPPNRTEALQGCRSKADGCLVTVDGDVTTIVAALFALAAAAGLIALLGVRFTSVKAAGVELSKRAYEEKAAGLPTGGKQERLDGDEDRENETRAAGADTGEPEENRESPVRVDIRRGLGTELGVVPVAVASLDSPMNPSQGAFLRDYQG
jgi:hypothetical protein